MRTISPALFLAAAALLLVGVAFAGPETIIRERAKELRDQNNVRQGVAPPTKSPQSANTQNPAPTPAPQQQAMTRLQTDLVAIKAGVAATPQQTAQLTNDLTSLAQGAKPSAAAVSGLANALAAALAVKSLPAADRGRLTQDLNAILNAANFPETQMNAILADVQAIFQANGVARKEAVAVHDAAKALVTEIRNGGAR